jgi:hypothetical protein
MDIIKQIMPADGWYARLSDYEDDGSEGLKPLACWALVEISDDEGLITEVKGMVAWDRVEFCEDLSNFVRYEKKTSD